jgi:hypothetical protein
MSIDAMQQALEALEYHQEQTRPIHKTQETIAALRKAIREAALDGLAQTSQEIEWDTSDMAHRSGGLSVEQSKNPLDIVDRAYFAGKKDGIDETIALIRSMNK